jgi:hypothetical protein
MPSASRYLAQLCRHFSNLRRHESLQDAAHAYARRDVQARQFVYDAMLKRYIAREVYKQLPRPA